MKTLLLALAAGLLLADPAGAQQKFFNVKSTNVTTSGTANLCTQITTNPAYMVAAAGSVYFFNSPTNSVDSITIGPASNAMFYTIATNTGFEYKIPPDGKNDLTNWWMSSATATQQLRVIYSVPK